MSSVAATTTISAQSRAMDYARRYGIVVVFVALLVILATTLPQFRTAANLRNVLQQNAVIGIIACAMTFAIISGGFDLSVGAGAALSSVVGAWLIIHLAALTYGAKRSWQLIAATSFFSRQTSRMSFDCWK